MFKNILLFELRQWFKKPLVYIYAGALLAMAMLIMAVSGGVFEGSTATVSSLLYINSTVALNGVISGVVYMGILLLPSLVGASIHKDYKENSHYLLYSYPISKVGYFFAKFLSGLIISFVLFVIIAVGAVLACSMKGIDASLIGPFNFTGLLQIYGIYVLPNLFLFGCIVFGVVTFTRSVLAGFVALIVLFFFQGVADTFIGRSGNETLGAMLDPFGINASMYYTKYWTITEQNENLLPLGKLVIWNRLLWTGLGAAILALSYKFFNFSQQPTTLGFRKKSVATAVQDDSTKIIRVNLPKVSYASGFSQSMKSLFALTKLDFKHVITGAPFIIVTILGLLFVLLMALFSGQLYQTETLPVTRELLFIPGFTYNMFVVLLTFIYAGLLINRSWATRMYQLEDSTPTKNWSFVLSKFLTVILMQAVLLLLIIIVGIGIQIYKGYYNFEIGLYLTDLIGIRWVNFIVWAFLAVVVHTIIPNFYLGLFLLLSVSIGVNFLGRIGIEQSIFKYNQGPWYQYSDMDGFGSRLPAYFLYKLYWIGLGIVFLFLSMLWWRRGIPVSFRERWRKLGIRFNPRIAMGLVFGTIIFLGMGSWIYYENNIEEQYYSSKEREVQMTEFEKSYKRYADLAQPRLIDVKLDVDIYPDNRDYKVDARFILKNKTTEPIDTLVVNHGSHNIEFSFSEDVSLAVNDTLADFKVYGLHKTLMPGEEMTMNFTMYNDPNRPLDNNSMIRGNGTFFSQGYFPSFGYDARMELTDRKTRVKYGLEPKERMMPPSDTSSLMNNYISNDADWIQFEATLSTDPSQIAIAPGYLQREWEEDGRRYFHYKMDSKMLNFYSICSAEYEVKKDKWNDVNLEIYYHKDHNYNIDRMIKGMKHSLAYCSENFSPYQHKQLRILEFPSSGGMFAQSFANTVPFSEAVGFIADVDDDSDSSLDYPYSITAHETAHQWWAHQVIAGNAQGATITSESMSEYVALKVLEKEYGKDKMRIFLKDALDKYLLGRTAESKKELPLMYNENQAYIHYNKGSMVFYALSDYLGEDVLNGALRKYLNKVKFQEPPYTTGYELVQHVKEVVPDSLSYLIEDMFENITLYDNRVKDEPTYTKLDDGRYKVDFHLEVIKYRNDEKGRRLFKNAEGDSISVHPEGQRKPTVSYPLQDYIEVGIFGTEKDGDKDKEKVLYLKKHKFTDISNMMSVIVDSEPQELGIDPFNKLIDANGVDNRRKVREAK